VTCCREWRRGSRPRLEGHALLGVVAVAVVYARGAGAAFEVIQHMCDVIARDARGLRFLGPVEHRNAVSDEHELVFLDGLYGLRGLALLLLALDDCDCGLRQGHTVEFAILRVGWTSLTRSRGKDLNTAAGNLHGWML
jgi:hypothetical protein